MVMSRLVSNGAGKKLSATAAARLQPRRVAVKHARGLASNASPPPSSGPGIGPILLSLAILGPSSFVVFKLRGDQVFRAEFEEKFPAVMPYLEPLLKGMPSKATEGTGAEKNTESSKSVVEEEIVTVAAPINWAEVKWELEQLEQRADEAGILGHSESFSSEEVANIQKSVEEADAKAQEDAAKADNSSDGVAAQEAVPALPREKGTDISLARRALNAVKSSYNALFSSSAKSSKEKIAELESKANKELEEVLARDLAGLDADGLRRRVVQLTLELKDRNRWEALRLHELTKATNEETSEKYEKLLRQQEEKYEELLQLEIRNAADAAADAVASQADERLHKVIREKETAWMKHTQERLEQQKDRLRAEMETRIAERIGDIEQKALADKQKQLSELEGARAEITALEHLFQQHAENDATSLKLHAVSTALLDLVDRRSCNAPLETQVAKVRSAGAGDPVIEAALSQFPETALVKGVPTAKELATEFKSVRRGIQKAELAPKDSGVVKSVLASVMTKIKLSESGLIEGDDVDACTARVQYYLDHGDVAKSVAELEKLDPSLKEAAAKWLVAARERLAVDQSVIMLKIHVSSIASSLTGESH